MPGTRQEMAEERVQLVVFRLGEEEFGVNILQTRGIHRPPKITVLPKMPDFVEGVFNLAGEIIPIVDLRRRFGLGQTAKTADSRIVIVEVANAKVGLIVDMVTETLWVSWDIVAPPPAAVASIEAEYIQGIAKLEGRLLILLDLEHILTAGEHAQVAELGAEVRQAAV